MTSAANLAPACRADADGTHWFAVLTNAKSEQIAEQSLLRLGLHTFYPRERVKRRRTVGPARKQRLEVIERALFKRYVFVLARWCDLHRVNRSHGVSTVVTLAGAPVAIPDEVIGAIMARTDEDGIMGSSDETARKRFMKGQQVRFRSDSAFIGLCAQVEVDLGIKIRLRTEMFGGMREIDVHPAVVEEIA